MSWAEIKKFVNSGKTPLNEYLDEMTTAVETYVVTGTAHNELKTVLDITGSGRLHCVSVSNKTNSNSRIIITVDGDVVLDSSVTMYNANTNYVSLLHVGNPDQIRVAVYGTSGRNQIICPFFNVSSSSDLSATMYLPFKSEEQSVSIPNGGTAFVELTAPLKFKKSLKIQVKGTSSNDNFGIMYDLG